MQITVRYVAALRDRTGRPGETITLPADTTDSEAVIARLRESDTAAEALAHPSVRLILNDTIVPRPAMLADGDILAFCPPFTGG